MRRIVYFTVYQFFFWMLTFVFFRTLYLVFLSHHVIEEGAKLGHTLASYLHGFQLDIATASYISGISFFVWLLQSIKPYKFFNQFHYYYTLFIIIVISLITAAEIGLFPEWRTKLSVKALRYLQNPMEIYRSTATSAFVFLVFLLFTQVLLLFWIYRRWFYRKIDKLRFVWYYSLIYAVLTPSLLFLGMRGGVSPVPINQSNAFYSQVHILNLASMNSGYNLIHNIIENNNVLRGNNPFRYMPEYEANELLSSLYGDKPDSVFRFLTTNKPNIVMLIMESWTADLVLSITGDSDFSPNFRKWEKEGVLLTNMYASGSRSEQGLAAILSGFPATPYTGVTHHHDKFVQLPSITSCLAEKGYHSSFTFGGELMYGNIKAYIYHNGFDRITEQKDIPKPAPVGKLGVHDAYMFQYFLQELNQNPQPFFSALFTLSSHEPFDFPDWHFKDFGTSDDRFINGALYTDSCLGVFMDMAKKQSWYENTLFVIVADHGHHSHISRSFYAPEYRKIPMLLAGNVIKPEYKGTKWNRITMQTDIPKSLLGQMNAEENPFSWSRDMFQYGANEFAYYEAMDALGWVRPYGYFVYHNQSDRFFFIDLPDTLRERTIKEGKAFQQQIFQHFLDL